MSSISEKLLLLKDTRCGKKKQVISTLGALMAAAQPSSSLASRLCILGTYGARRDASPCSGKHRSGQVTDALRSHCSEVGQLPPGQTGTQTAEARTPEVREARGGFTEEGDWSRVLAGQ